MPARRLSAADLDAILTVCARHGVSRLRTPDGLEISLGVKPVAPQSQPQIPADGWPEDGPTTFEELERALPRRPDRGAD